MIQIEQHCGRSKRFHHGRVAMVLALSLSAATGAQASTFGNLSSVSAIGAPLRIEIRSSDGALPASCLRTVSRNAGDGIPSVAGARIEVAREGAGSRIVIARSEPARDPILRLVIENRCGGSFTREYMLLLPEPAELAQPAAAPTRATAASPRPTRPAARAPITRGDRWTTAPGESVDSLANALYPRDAGARRAFVSSVLNDNPEVFKDRSSPSASVLPAGTEIIVPSPGRIVAASSRPAAVARPPAAVASRPAPARNEDSATQAAAARPAPTVETTTAADRLLLKGEDIPTDGASPAPNLNSARQADENLREELLVGAIDRTINVQLDLLDRIRRLEEIQVALRDNLEPMPTTATGSAGTASQAPPTTVAPEPSFAPAPQPAPERAPSAPDGSAQTNSTYWVVGLLVIALLLGILLIRRLTAVPEVAPRRTFARPVVAGAASSPAPATALPREPATELHTIIPAAPNTAGAEPGALAWDTGEPETAAPAAARSTLAADDDAIGDHDSAIELAEIMVSFGRVSGATETLADFIRANPKQAVTPWLKLLDLYHKTQKRDEFETLARHLNKTFNVMRITWENFGTTHARSQGLEHLPHIVGRLIGSWRTRECQSYIETLLRDNRDGTRQGFPLGVIDELLVLSAILEQELGRIKTPSPQSDPPAA